MMEAMRAGGRVGVGVEDDMGDGMQCSDHPYRNNPGGICAFCLQEKLGKLVSSSFPLPVRASTSSSSSPSFRSDTGNIASSGFVSNGVVHASSSSSSSSNPLSLSLSVKPASSNAGPFQEYYTRRARIPFLLAKKKKKVMAAASSSSSEHHHHHRAADVVFKRSKSTATPRRGRYLDDGEDFSPRKRNGFWSFLYLSTSKTHSGSSRKMDKLSSLSSTSSTTASTASAAASVKEKSMGSSSSMSKKGAFVVVEEDDSPSSQTNASASSFDRKVSRSRSVGCGSRSFSGDFFERISTGFGDCTLRRVESQREGKSKSSASSAASASAMKERVRCGGIFGGFIMTSSSSSSSSSSYWVSEEMNGKNGGQVVQNRSRSWGWAFASPMRAFSSKPGRRDTVAREGSNKNSTTPNLSATPSLLAVRS